MPRCRRFHISALVALLGFGCSPAERNDAGEIETAGSIDAFMLRVGDCFDDPTFDEDTLTDVPGVPCTTPHDNEVFAAFDLQGTSWPGDATANELADEGCMERFEGAIEATYEESVLVVTELTPSEASWNGRKDREVICVAYHMDLEKLTGSVLGSGK
jgi:hypothetical protein